MPGDTQQLVGRLLANVHQVRPLPHPWVRTVTWCALSLPVLGLVVAVITPASVLRGSHVDRPIFVEQLAAVATAVTAAAAAFASTVPGYRRRIVLLPLLPLAMWLGYLAQWCIQDGAGSGVFPWSSARHWGCVPATVLASAFPATAMFMMLRQGAPLTPRLTTMLGAVAAGGLGNFGVRFMHVSDTGVVVLAWHFSAVFGLCILSALAGRSLFSWQDLVHRNGIGGGAWWSRPTP